MTIQIVLDTECYQNYWLCMFKRLDNGATIAFELYDDHPLNIEKLQQILENPAYEFVSFNGIKYDTQMIRYALTGTKPERLKRASDALIVEGLQWWDFEKRFACVDLKCNHIDLIEVAKGDCSLKLYAGRLHAKKMQDLPIEPDAWITPEQREELKIYCRNDLDNTELLLNEYRKNIDERRVISERYGMDVRSKSDAQIAEAVIKSEVEKITGQPVRKIKPDYKEFIYEPPAYIAFQSEQLKNALQILRDNPFTIKENGVVEMPKVLQDLRISIGDSVYQMGMGGLHSTENERSLHAVENKQLLIDADVSSYYPSLIIKNGLSPENMGDVFMDVYRGIREKRMGLKGEMNRLESEIKELEKQLANL